MIDKKDKLILELLQKNAKLTTKQIAKKTLLPITTVHNRIKKLEKQEIIKKYSIILDNKKLGNLLTAYILINIDYQELKNLKLTQADIANKLFKIQNIQTANVVTGSKDIIASVLAKDVEELNEIIASQLQSIPGIKQTETLVVLY